MHLVSCGLWELHCALIQGSQDWCRHISYCKFGVLSLWLRTFRHSGFFLWEIVQIIPTKKTIALWKLPAHNHNHSVGMKHSFPWRFFYLSFVSLLLCEMVVCDGDLGTFFHLTLSGEKKWATSVHLYYCSDITFAVRRINNKPVNDSEVGIGWYEMACFLINH